MARKRVNPQGAENYRHPEAESPSRPEVGTQPQFRKKKPPVTYRYDSSLSPALDWDGQNPARERGEALIGRILKASSLDEARVAAEELKALSRPFLDWSGKAERLSFDVPTLPLFVHERLSTRAIIDTLTGHKRDKQLDLFADPRHPVTDQLLKSYEHKDPWVNRMVLGDSLVVMNSLLHYEGLGGQVQMIYMDPPYGVKFGSNFQPFVRRRDVKHNEDEDMSREPEMVKAYRDTWELGLHSYLTYMRDRLLLARDLLHPSGSIFVQISDENLHHVREVMDEVFGAENCCAVITFTKTTGQTRTLIPVVADYLVWYAKDRERTKFRQLYERKTLGGEGASEYFNVELPDGLVRRMTSEETANASSLPVGTKVFATDSIVSDGFSGENSADIELEQDGKKYTLKCGAKRHWKVGVDGIKRLWDGGRLLRREGLRIYKRYFDDFPYLPLDTVWAGTRGEPDMSYVVQTSRTVVERCLLMTTDPGDLVLDPTCGSGTTAYVAEQWGRRWITTDVSRVPLALARQRILTATFPWYELKEPERGPAGGFVYQRKQNRKGEEVGGIVPHVTLKSIANNEPPDEEVLVDRPEVESGITRVSGPFVVEATIPTPVDWEGDSVEDSGTAAEHGSFTDRMLEVLRHSPVLHVGGGKKVELKSIRQPAKTLSLSAEAVVANGNGKPHPHPNPLPEARELNEVARSPEGEGGKPVAIVFGPENGAVSETLVFQAAREANAKNYTHLYVIGFAIQPNARKLIEDCEAAIGIPATWVQATPDLLMGDLLKNMRSSQIFSVCGLPEIKLTKTKAKGDEAQYQAELLGLDVFDPVTMKVDHRKGRRRAGLVARHRLQRAGVPCLPGLLSAHRRMGQPQARVEEQPRGKRLGSPRRHRERALRGRRARAGGGEGDRRPGERVAGGEEPEGGEIVISQTQADRLIAMLKEAARDEVLVWDVGRRQDELVVAVEERKIQFILSMKRNPFEIRLHFRTRDRDVGLVRLDAAPYHVNPDGTEIRGQPHLHVYREGYDLAWAEPVDWYDTDRPVPTLELFLDFIHTRFPRGIQMGLF
jgi:adenine-specific DNA-methyltransferase